MSTSANKKSLKNEPKIEYQEFYFLLLFVLGVQSFPSEICPRVFHRFRAQRTSKPFESVTFLSLVPGKCYQGGGSILLDYEVLTIESKHLSTLQTYPKLYEAGVNGQKISTASKARLWCSRSL